MSHDDIPLREFFGVWLDAAPGRRVKQQLLEEHILPELLARPGGVLPYETCASLVREQYKCLVPTNWLGVDRSLIENAAETLQPVVFAFVEAALQRGPGWQTYIYRWDAIHDDLRRRGAGALMMVLAVWDNLFADGSPDSHHAACCALNARLRDYRGLDCPRMTAPPAYLAALLSRRVALTSLDRRVALTWLHRLIRANWARWPEREAAFFMGQLWKLLEEQHVRKGKDRYAEWKYAITQRDLMLATTLVAADKRFPDGDLIAPLVVGAALHGPQSLAQRLPEIVAALAATDQRNATETVGVVRAQVYEQLLSGILDAAHALFSNTLTSTIGGQYARAT